MQIRQLLVRLLLLALLPITARAEMAAVTPLPSDPAGSIRLPDGFRMQVFAKSAAGGDAYFRGPRFMAFGPDGHLYLSTGMHNKVWMLPDRNHDGRADEAVLVSDRLNAPQGLVFVDGKLLVANQDGVVRLEREGQWPATKVTPLISELATGGHTLKTIKLGPDGHLYLNVGSSCNVCIESDPLRATILRYSKDGKPAGALVTLGRHAPTAVWASGLRNSQGMAWHPTTGAMFATNNGSDMRSSSKGGPVNDELPPEHLNRIEPGKHYGWPHCWGERITDPNFPGPDGFCAATEPPAITFDSHSTPLGISFLQQAAFPASYRNDAIVALHGSWNREQPSGYKLVRVRFKQDKPYQVSDFATGWLDGRGAWGRPVDVVVGPDGALYVSDDRSGMIYRIVHEAK